MQEKVNLLGYSYDSLEKFFKELNEPKFRARQLLSWIHQKGVIDIDLMTDLNKNLRNRLKTIATITPPKILKEYVSEEGTKKYLIELATGSIVEMVLIPEKKGKLYVFLLKQAAHYNALFVLPEPKVLIRI